MARLYPSDLDAAGLAGANPREIETLKALARDLPDDYSVYHGVHWAHPTATGKTAGEVDFVIVNRSGDVLVIEQKDGGLEETGQGLVKRYANGAQSVTSQIERNCWNLVDRFKRQVGTDAKLAIDHLIYCPDHTVVNVSGPGIDMARIVDASAKACLAEHVVDLLGPGSESKDNWAEIVCDFFAQTFRVLPDVSSYVASQDRVYLRMLEGMGEAIGKIEFSPYRLRVVGTAGCGKSQLTISYCRREIANGRKPILLCFNRPLADKLGELVPDGARVDTYYGFCKKTLESLTPGLTIRPTQEPGFWREVQDQLVGVDIPEETLFDTLIVDEGQDFKQEWWEILQLFLREDTSVLWLEDPLQNLRQTAELELDGFVTYREDANFRTPVTIGEVIREALGVDFTQRNQLPGLGVHVEPYDKPGEQQRIVAHRINELRRSGFSNEEIVLVSCRGMSSSAFRDCEKIGGVPVRRFTGEYTPEGDQIYTDGKLYWDTIYRFKGQQAPAVILVDVDETLGDSEYARRVLYCGMTRATVRLEMLVHQDNHWLPALERAAN